MFETLVPWQVGLVFQAWWTEHRPLLCSGTLITKRHVLTVAHCVKEAIDSKVIFVILKLMLYAVLSEINLANSNDGQIYIPVKKLMIHPGNNFYVLYISS